MFSRSNNTPPPPYSQYPQQSSGYLPSNTEYYDWPPLYHPEGTVVAPGYQHQWNNQLVTPITPYLRTFLIVSGILSLIWGIVAISLEVGIIFNSETTYYRGLWAGGFLIGGGLSMLVASCREAYRIYYLKRLFTITLLFVVLGLILSIINLASSVRCSPFYRSDHCDESLATNLKISILALFIISTIHTITNIVVANNAQKITIPTSSLDVPRY